MAMIKLWKLSKKSICMYFDWRFFSYIQFYVFLKQNFYKLNWLNGLIVKWILMQKFFFNDKPRKNQGVWLLCYGALHFKDEYNFNKTSKKVNKKENPEDEIDLVLFQGLIMCTH